ncbi:C-type mannose receptor 2-like [Centroberyx affinis]|uniref:C-type mannose receptor 2-like n=1 Tax=Centroberyx affinis TaxID=166261 RepID=UPI003A5B9CEF
MKGRTILITLLSVLGAVYHCLGHKYYFIRIKKNWKDAQSYCRANYTDLATVDNMEDMNALANLVEGFTGRAWIGLYDETKHWKWSLSDKSYYNAGEEEFRNWSPEEPNNYNSKQHCVAMYESGKWNDQNCAGMRDFICYNNRSINGRPPVSGKYIQSPQTMTWADAQRYCRERYIDLASVRNQAENQEILELKPENTNVWIGLYREPWSLWSDGSNSSFKYWRDSEPSDGGGACAAMVGKYHGKWADWHCMTLFEFVCYYEVKRQVFKMKLSSSMDPNAPAEALLQQMERKLRESGVNADVKLSWRARHDGNVFLKQEEREERRLTWKEG